MQLVDYERYIVSNNFVEISKARYYVAWVKKYLSLNLSDVLNNEEKTSQFMQYLSQDSPWHDWQLEQARHAVELYLGMLSPKVDNSEPENINSFADIENKLRIVLRLKHYSYRTEQTYLDWCRRYYQYCQKEKIDLKSSLSVKNYLTYLAVKRKVAGATQSQAFNSILFMFRFVLEEEIEDIRGAVRSKKKRNLPAVLSVDEIKLLFKQVDGLQKMTIELIRVTCSIHKTVCYTMSKVLEVQFNGVVRTN